MHTISFKWAFGTKVKFLIPSDSPETGEAINGTIERLVADQDTQHYEVLSTGGAIFDVTDDQIVGTWDDENAAQFCDPEEPVGEDEK